MMNNKDPQEAKENIKEALRSKALLAAAARLKQRVIEARKHPAAFIEFVFRTPEGKPIELQWFHKEWLNHFMNHKRVQIEAARSHGKTTITLGYIIWLIGSNPNVRIKLFTQSEDKARERLMVVANMIENDKLVKLVFPELKRNAKGPWHKKAIQVERDITAVDPTLQATGITGSVEGGRCDLVLFDDICDYRNSIAYPQVREAIKQKVLVEIMPMIEVDGSAISIATPHHEGDAVAAFRKNIEWKSYIYAVGTDEDIYKPLWPDRWNREALRSKRNEIGPIKYDAAYRCKALSMGMAIVKRRHIQYYTAEMIQNPWRLRCVQAYDLAITKKKGSSHFAGVTLLYDPTEDIVFVADAWHAKMDLREQSAEVISEHNRWKPDMIIVEETGYQSALRVHLHEQGYDYLNIVPMSPKSKSKELRLMDTVPMFELQKVFFNPRLDSQINPDQAVRGDLINQLLTFTSSKDQDLGDAFAYGMQGIQSFRYGRDDDSTWNKGSGISTRMTMIG